MYKFVGAILFLLLLSCSGNTGRNNQQETEPTGTTSIEFKDDTHNFGNLKAGEIVVYTFEFSNTGNHDFKIESIECDCGCVQTSFAKEAVKPGDTSRIEVEFDTSGLAGREYKTIEVHGNSNELKHLAIFAQVENELLDFKY